MDIRIVEPCPKCGTVPEYIISCEITGLSFIRCSSCGYDPRQDQVFSYESSSPEDALRNWNEQARYNSRENVLEAWNRRAQP